MSQYRKGGNPCRVKPPKRRNDFQAIRLPQKLPPPAPAIAGSRYNVRTGVFLADPAPASAVMDLASARNVKLIAVDDKTMNALKKENPGYNKLIIKARAK